MHVHLHIRPRAPGDGVLTVRPCEPSDQAELAAHRRPHPYRPDVVAYRDGDRGGRLRARLRRHRPRRGSLSGHVERRNTGPRIRPGHSGVAALRSRAGSRRMKLLHYLEIRNFKRFGDSERIELDHPAVLIGPNNCGKTTAIQAIALWSQAVRAWHASKGKAPPRQRTSTSLNRLNIVAVPVQRTRYFWHNAAVRTGNTDIPLRITVGILHDHRVEPVTMRFAIRARTWCTARRTMRPWRSRNWSPPPPRSTSNCSTRCRAWKPRSRFCSAGGSTCCSARGRPRRCCATCVCWYTRGTRMTGSGSSNG